MSSDFGKEGTCSQLSEQVFLYYVVKMNKVLTNMTLPGPINFRFYDYAGDAIWIKLWVTKVGSNGR